MRKLVLLAVLAVMTIPAGAATKVTVAQLEQTITASHSASDAKLADRLSGLELTERLSEARLARLKAGLPGEQARQALLVLADSAEFLNLPADEIPQAAAPDLATQRKIMAQVVRYTTKTIHELPNFFATRETTRFEDRPQYEYGYIPLHYVGKTRKNVVYRDGQEMVDVAAVKAGVTEPSAQGMVSWGEFGPILSTVLLDAAKSKLEWSHWEQSASGLLAVFGYAVPDPKSNYWVQYCCKNEELTALAPQEIVRQKTGYHGEITVDPATGAVLRITIDAELPLGEKVKRAATMVEYGTVEIGGKNYICPAHSVALSLMRYGHASTNDAHSILDHDPIKVYVNDVAFGQYHRLGSEVHILGENGEEMAQSSTGASAQPNMTNFQPASAQIVAPPAPTPNAPPTAPAIASAPPPPAQGAAAPSLAPAAALPSQSAPAQVNPPEQLLTLKANARAVELDVVVTDKKQAPVTGLGVQVFEVLEDGKPQTINYFEEHTAKPAPQSEAPKLAPNLYTNLPSAPVVDAVNVLLLDKINTPLEYQVKVHQQILDFLGKMKPGTKVAIFVLASRLRLIQGFTSDAEALRAAVNDKTNGDITEKTEASRSRQDDADDQDQADMHAVMMGGKQGRNGTGYSRAREGLTRAQADIAGNQAGERVGMTLTGLEFLARYLAGIQGRKNLIWFSSSFPVSVFPSGKELKGTLGTQSFDPGAKEASTLLANSDVAVYPVNAEGLQMDNATEASGYNQNSLGTLYKQADQRAIATEAVNKLASDTGGKAFYNTNDLAGALARAIDDGAHYYTLSYTPTNTKMDGGYRGIDVRLKEGNYDLAYRHGYFADETPSPEAPPNSDPLHPFLIRGAPASTQIVFSARLALADSQHALDNKVAGGNARLSDPLTRFRVKFNLRPDDLKLDVSPDGRHTGKIQVGLLAYDKDGAAVNWAGGILPISLSAEQFAAAQRTGIPAHLEIDLPRIQIFLEAGIYDWNVRKAGTLEIPIRATTSMVLDDKDFDWTTRQSVKP
jgi:VWFA-related protein